MIKLIAFDLDGTLVDKCFENTTDMLKYLLEFVERQ